MDVAQRLQTVVKASPHQRERLAATLSVSASTIDRWAAGTVTPTPRHLSALKEALADFSHPANQERLIRSLTKCLGQAREVMHKHGAASSRNDALDQISLLLTAHLHLKRNNQPGLQQVGDSDAGRVLRAAVAQLRDHMPQTAHERLLQSAGILASKQGYLAELVAALRLALDEMDSSPDWKRPHDFHEVFVNFLASSFHEEKEFAQYMTPREVVEFMVRIGLSLTPAENEHPTVLDPSCGTGSFLTTFAETYAERLEASGEVAKRERWLSHEAALHLIGVDTSERMIRLAMASFVAGGMEPRRLFLDSSIEPNGAETRAALAEGSVDLILTNPPFGAEHSRGRHGGGRVPSEVIYVERYVDWLRPGGIALSIIPDSILTNKAAFADLRDRLRRIVDLIAVVSLPPVTFAASGTTTKTSILAFRKKDGRTHGATLFAVAQHVGFEVSTRGSIRKRIPHPQNDLPKIADAIIFGQADQDIGATHRIDERAERWDAQFLTSPLAVRTGDNDAHRKVPVETVATLVAERADPRSEPGDVFSYIEISNVDGDLLRVSATETFRNAAPSRARRRVRAGDVLVSTVRPERKTIGVVPPHLDGAICSTGFAVLRPRTISPYVLAAALKAPDVTAQLVGISSGVAYPAFDARAVVSVQIDLKDDAWKDSCVAYGGSLEALELQRAVIFTS